MPTVYMWVCQRCGQRKTGKESTLTLFRGGPRDSPEPSGKGWVICGSCAEAVEQFMTVKPPTAEESSDGQ